MFCKYVHAVLLVISLFLVSSCSDKKVVEQKSPAKAATKVVSNQPYKMPTEFYTDDSMSRSTFGAKAYIDLHSLGKNKYNMIFDLGRVPSSFSPFGTGRGNFIVKSENTNNFFTLLDKSVDFAKKIVASQIENGERKVQELSIPVALCIDVENSCRDTSMLMYIVVDKRAISFHGTVNVGNEPYYTDELLSYKKVDEDKWEVSTFYRSHIEEQANKLFKKKQAVIEAKEKTINEQNKLNNIR